MLTVHVETPIAKKCLPLSHYVVVAMTRKEIYTRVTQSYSSVCKRTAAACH